MTRGTRAVVVYPDIAGEKRHIDATSRLEEARGLAEAIGIAVVDAFAISVRSPKAATLFGAGQVERIESACNLEDAELLIVDGVLGPIQQRNLEERLKRKVIDRTGLILEIFGARAKTKEGRLQVELAALTYQRSRLVRSWTHLERQRGLIDEIGRSEFGARVRQDISDLRLLQRIMDEGLINQTQTQALQAMGVVLGDIYVAELGLQWRVYRDEEGKSRAVCVPDTSHCLFPVTMISKRASLGVKPNIRELYERGVSLIKEHLPKLPYSAP